MPATALGAWNLWRAVSGVALGPSVQAHALVQIYAFAIPLGVALGPEGGRHARRLLSMTLAAVAVSTLGLASGKWLPFELFGPTWHLGLFGVALPLALERCEAGLRGGTAVAYALGVAVCALGLALPMGHVLVQAGRGAFAAALLLSVWSRRPRVAATAIWIAAASLATVANAIRELAGAPASDELVSDSVRHAFAIGGVALPLLVLAAPRARRAIVALASLAAGLRLFVVPLAYGPAVLAPAAGALVSVSGALGVLAIVVAARVASIDTPRPR